MLALCNRMMLGDASGFAACESLADVAFGLFLGFLLPLTKQDLCPALHAGASFCCCSCTFAFAPMGCRIGMHVRTSHCLCCECVCAWSTLAQLKVPASMQEHCVAALLRLHKKQIMRLRSPEDFIQVQPLCVTACNILHYQTNSCLAALQHLAHGFTRCYTTVVMHQCVMQRHFNRPKILLLNSD